MPSIGTVSPPPPFPPSFRKATTFCGQLLASFRFFPGKLWQSSGFRLPPEFNFGDGAFSLFSPTPLCNKSPSDFFSFFFFFFSRNNLRLWLPPPRFIVTLPDPFFPFLGFENTGLFSSSPFFSSQSEEKIRFFFFLRASLMIDELHLIKTGSAFPSPFPLFHSRQQVCRISFLPPFLRESIQSPPIIMLV